MSARDVETSPRRGFFGAAAEIGRDALRRPLADYYLIMASAAAMVGIGLFMVLSASSVFAMFTTGSPYTYGKWQLMVAVIGVPVALVCSRLSQRTYELLSWVAVGGAIVLLALTIVPHGFGVSSGGNQAWLKLGPLPAIQPSEFAKPALVIWSATLFATPWRARKLDRTRVLLMPYLPIAGLVLVLVLAEKDLGTAVIIALIILLQLWFVGARGKTLAALIGVAGVGAAIMVITSATRRAKVLAFLAGKLPFLHLTPPPVTSDQPDNALYALATGGWWGVGPGASRQKWGGLYNGAHTDYILAVLGEELGLFGVLVVLGLLFTLVYTGLRIAHRSKNTFWRVTAAGMTGWLMVQATINTLVAFGLMPVMGVPFPMLSYGGSALLACFVAIGVLLAAARHEPEAEKALSGRKSPNKARPVTGVVVAQRRTSK
ncbi:MAG: putative lipid II flippase FtsW [Propionibacteriaceae bacterium]|nr:putative lipid II flippase FtsW [Propionibacteriaceae bacterium]